MSMCKKAIFTLALLSITGIVLACPASLVNAYTDSGAEVHQRSLTTTDTFSTISTADTHINMANLNSSLSISTINESTQQIIVTNNTTGERDLILVKDSSSGSRSSYLWDNIGDRTVNINDLDSANSKFVVSASQGLSIDGVATNPDLTISDRSTAGWTSTTFKVAVNPANVAAAVAAIVTLSPLGAVTTTIANFIVTISGNNLPTVYIKIVRHARVISTLEQEYYYDYYAYSKSNYSGLIKHIPTSKQTVYIG